MISISILYKRRYAVVWNGIPLPLSASGTIHLDDCANTNALAVKHSFNQDCASDKRWEPA